MSYTNSFQTSRICTINTKAIGSFPYTLCGLLLILVLGCTSPAEPEINPLPSIHDQPIKLEQHSKQLIGQKIWQNEAGGTIEGLSHWNKSEGFASLGIGHFIWFPENKTFIFQESFPALIKYLVKNGVDVPGWLIDAPCPWPNFAAFQAAKQSNKMKALRRLLTETISLQLDFIVQRSQLALDRMLAASDLEQHNRIIRQYYAVAQTPRGMYALIDYVNFKGEGIKASERYKSQGWGLRDVLLGMGDDTDGLDAAYAFSESAKKVLTRRVNNGPTTEKKWLKGWLERCDSYAKAL